MSGKWSPNTVASCAATRSSSACNGTDSLLRGDASPPGSKGTTFTGEQRPGCDGGGAYHLQRLDAADRAAGRPEQFRCGALADDPTTDGRRFLVVLVTLPRRKVAGRRALHHKVSRGERIRTSDLLNPINAVQPRKLATRS